MLRLQLLLIPEMAVQSLFHEFDFVIQNEKAQAFEIIKNYIESQKRFNYFNGHLDFLVCELYPKHKVLCQKFYEQEGPPLKDVISIEEKASMEQTLLLFLDVVEIAKQHHLSWREIIKITPRVSY